MRFSQTLENFELSQKFIKIDLASGHPWAEDWSFSDADIFTLSFVLSEVWRYNGNLSVTNFLQALFQTARVGAIFVYSDNGGPAFLPHMEGVVGTRNDIAEVYAANDEWMLIGSDEQQNSLGEYLDRFKQQTKKTGNVNRRIWKKVA